MSTTSLRSRLTFALMASIGIPLVVAGVLAATLVPSWLQRSFDDSLQTRARALVSLASQEDGEVEIEFSDEAMPEFEDDDDPYFFEFRLADGELIERSRSYHPSREVKLPDLPREAEVSDEPRLHDLVLPDGRRGRCVRIDFVPELPDPEDEEEEDDEEDEPFEEDEPALSPTAVLEDGSALVANVMVAGSTEELDARVATIRLVAILGTILLLGALVGFVRLALRLGLAPMDVVVRQVSEMNAESLGERIDASRAPAELEPLLTQLNDFIERLSVAFRRERQLTADIAHELKTPIAELRSLGEVGERWPDDREAVTGFFADARAVARQMEQVVLQLLALARHDAGQQVVRLREVDVAKLVEASWRPVADAAGERDVRFAFDADAEADVGVRSDPEMLGLVLCNLLSNAVTHGAPGSEVRCRAVAQADAVRVSVTNEAPDLEPRDLEVMFDRFWRKDPARTSGSSAGLGLSLVRAFTGLLGIAVDAQLQADGRLRVDLLVPRALPERAELPEAATG